MKSLLKKAGAKLVSRMARSELEPSSSRTLHARTDKSEQQHILQGRSAAPVVARNFEKPLVSLPMRRCPAHAHVQTQLCVGLSRACHSTPPQHRAASQHPMVLTCRSPAGTRPHATSLRCSAPKLHRRVGCNLPPWPPLYVGRGRGCHLLLQHQPCSTGWLSAQHHQQGTSDLRPHPCVLPQAEQVWQAGRGLHAARCTSRSFP